jgi:hypothetical protein
MKFTLLLIASQLLSCGRKDQKVNMLVSTTSENSALSNLKNLKDETCSISKCQSVDFKITDENKKEVKDKSLAIGDEADWQFTIQSNSIEGRLMLFTKQIPVWSNIKKGQYISSLSVLGTADQEVSDGKIVLVVRDLMKCKNTEEKITEEKNTEEKIKICLQTDEIISSYDKEKTIGYAVSKK